MSDDGVRYLWGVYAYTFGSVGELVHTYPLGKRLEHLHGGSLVGFWNDTICIFVAEKIPLCCYGRLVMFRKNRSHSILAQGNGL